LKLFNDEAVTVSSSKVQTVPQVNVMSSGSSIGV